MARLAHGKRKSRVSSNYAGANDLSSFRGHDGQWPKWARLYLGGTLRGVLTWEDQVAIMHGGNLPIGSEAAKRLELAHKQNWEWCLTMEAKEIEEGARAQAELAEAEEACMQQAQECGSEYGDAESDFEWAEDSVDSAASERSDEDWDASASECGSEDSSIYYADELDGTGADSSATTASVPSRAPGPTPRKPLTYDLVKKVAKKWCKCLIMHQNVENVVKNGRGYKLRKNRPLLNELKDMVVDCWRDEQDNRRMFHNLDEVERYDAAHRQKEIDDNLPADSRRAGKSFAEIKAALGVSNRTLWHQLKAVFKMRRMRLTLKRRRKNIEVKVRCQRRQCVARAGLHSLWL